MKFHFGLSNVDLAHGECMGDGELICPPPPGCQAYTHPQLISNLINYKIKLISTLHKQKKLIGWVKSKI